MISRRQLLLALPSSCGLAVICSGCFKKEESQPHSRIINLGPLSQFPPGLTMRTTERIAILHDQQGLCAMSALCTHQVCMLRPANRAGWVFECPCHGSRFDSAGAVLQGPAEQPLPFYALSRTKEDELLVDLSKRVAPEVRIAAL